MKEYALVKLDHDDKDFVCVCEGKRGLITRMVDDVTNTIGWIKYRDIITGETVGPRYTDDEGREHKPNGLSYSTIVNEITRDEVIDKLREYSSNRKALIDYICHVNAVKKITKVENQLEKSIYRLM